LGVIEKAKSTVPLKRLATCEEIAWMVAYLASPAGDYITGQTFTVDGGKTLWGDLWPIPDPPDLEPIVIPKESWE
jgi:NAD(P)-dependent dehydrogenase (short-subunit alcohol dehydrogenase family)